MGKAMDSSLVAPMVRSHSVSILLVHVVWSTGDRAPLLEAAIDGPLARALGRTAQELTCQVLAVGNAVDHVHVVVKHPPAIAVSELVRHLKGASSHQIAAAGWVEPGIRWQVGYWAESVGTSQLAPLLRYVAMQRAHHTQLSAREPWETAHGLAE
jgi:putative transposase